MASEIAYVLFKRPNWNVAGADKWLFSHGFEDDYGYETKTYSGGKNIKPGKYIVVKVSDKKFSRYAYSKQVKREAVYFKYGFK